MARRRDERGRNLARRYGITIDEYDTLHEQQDGVCAICNQPPPDGQRLVVDHCHDTGRIRGLLCSRCNTAIGFLGDDPCLVATAASYLE